MNRRETRVVTKWGLKKHGNANGRKDCMDIQVSFWVDGRAGLYNAGALEKGGSLHHHADHTN